MSPAWTSRLFFVDYLHFTVLSHFAVSHCTSEETVEQCMRGEMTRRKGGWIQGKGGSCRHLRSSNQNSEADQVDMKFVPPPPPPPPSSFTPYPQGSYCLSLFFMPASPLHMSSNPSPISPLWPRIARCFTLFASYNPPSSSAPTCLFSSPTTASPGHFASFPIATDKRRNKWRSAY